MRRAGADERAPTAPAASRYVHDSQHWCLQTDSAMLVAILATLTGQRLMKKKGALRLLGALEDAEADWLTSLASRTVRFQFLLMYLAAGLWKVRGRLSASPAGRPERPVRSPETQTLRKNARRRTRASCTSASRAPPCT